MRPIEWILLLLLLVLPLLFASPLHEVILEGDVPSVQHLLSSSKVNVNEFSENTTPLILATEKNHEAIVALLLRHGADPNLRELSFNETALFKASFKGYVNIAQQLISFGADVKLRIKNDETCLMWSSFKGFSDISRLLIRAGADVNAQDMKYGFTPLMVAAKNGHFASVELLLESGANPRLLDKAGRSELQHAQTRGDHEIVALLKDKSPKEL